MSPEAIVRPSELDARGDLYALGAVGYFLLTGTPPFRSSSMVEICSMQLHTVPELPSARSGRAIDPTLEAAIMKCLEKAPAARPNSARELAQALPALAGWSHEQSEAWWSDHAPAIERYKAQRGQATDSNPIAPTLAVNLREREQHAPWHSSASLD
jgi:serine/threonine protein kinase